MYRASSHPTMAAGLHQNSNGGQRRYFPQKVASQNLTAATAAIPGKSGLFWLIGST
jgi:hypothetical protein